MHTPFSRIPVLCDHRDLHNTLSIRDPLVLHGRPLLPAASSVGTTSLECMPIIAFRKQMGTARSMAAGLLVISGGPVVKCRMIDGGPWYRFCIGLRSLKLCHFALHFAFILTVIIPPPPPMSQIVNCCGQSEAFLFSRIFYSRGVLLPLGHNPSNMSPASSALYVEIRGSFFIVVAF